MRAGNDAEAADLLRRRETRMLGGPARALADALYSWSLDRQGHPPRPIDRVTLFGEASTDALRRVWPELADFVDRAPAE